MTLLHVSQSAKFTQNGFKRMLEAVKRVGAKVLSFNDIHRLTRQTKITIGIRVLEHSQHRVLMREYMVEIPNLSAFLI